MPDPDSAQSIGWLIVALAALAAGINQIVAIFDRFRAKEPEPPLHQLYATQEAMRQVDAKVQSLAVEMREGFHELREERSRATGNLHERLEEITDKMRAEMKRDIDGVHSRINDVLAAVSNLKGRIEK